MNDLGRALIVAGALIAALGGVLLVAGKIPFLGKLPGDFSFEGKNVRFYFPLATSVLLSIALTLLFAVLSRFRR